MKTRLFLSVLICLLGEGLFASGAQEEFSLSTKDGEIPSEARIESAVPLKILPGCLIFLSGHDLGRQPTHFSIGEIPVSKVLKWTDETIVFRYPGKQAPTEAIRLNIPSANTVVFSAADPDSETVRWTIDPVRAQKLLDDDRRSLDNDSPLRFLFLFKIHVEGIDQNLDVMKMPSGIWFTEILLSPKNGRDALVPHLFSLVSEPQSGSDARKALAILQDLWAQSDPYLLVKAAPAFSWGNRDNRYDPSSKRLNLFFP